MASAWATVPERKTSTGQCSLVRVLLRRSTPVPQSMPKLLLTPPTVDTSSRKESPSMVELSTTLALHVRFQRDEARIPVKLPELPITCNSSHPALADRTMSPI